MGSLRFRAPIALNNINPYVLVSAERAARLQPGWRKPMPVCIRVNGQPGTPWRINMMPVGDGSFYLYLHGDVRKASGTQVGDTVSVEVAFDSSYQSGPTDPIPPWFSEALAQNPAAQQTWMALIPSRQKELVRQLARLKSPEAQARNLQQAMFVLAGGKARFMARDWNAT